MNGEGYEKSGYITNVQDVCSHSVTDKNGEMDGDIRIQKMIRIIQGFKIIM